MNYLPNKAFELLYGAGESANSLRGAAVTPMAGSSSGVGHSRPQEAMAAPNYAMLEALRQIATSQEDRRLTPVHPNVDYLREARAGAMYGLLPE